MTLKTGQRTANPSDGIRERRLSPSELNTFQRLLYDQAGIVLTDNKRALVESRVAQRLRRLQLDSFGAYLEYLQQDQSGEELVHLIDVISTNVTHFFRESDHFTLLDKVVTQWTEAGRRRLRFWSAACSTGEEPYSMAMTLQKQRGRGELDLKILATDISTRVLAHAQTGRYQAARLSEMDAAVCKRNFTRVRQTDGEMWEVRDDLKNMIMFRRLNFTAFPYPIKGCFDVIFCRNAMIYFDRSLRSRMVAEFARLLQPEGYLIVGHAETLIGLDAGFRTVAPSVYQRLNHGESS